MINPAIPLALVGVALMSWVALGLLAGTLNPPNPFCRRPAACPSPRSARGILLSPTTQPEHKQVWKIPGGPVAVQLLRLNPKLLRWA